MMILSWFLGFFFRWLYHSFAWAYDFVAAIVSTGQWKSWVTSVSAYLAGPLVLELGHGPGHLQVNLKAQGRSVYGVDESRQMGYLAQKRLRKKGFSQGLVRGAAQALPYPANTFHQVVSTFPSEYITDPQTMLEIYRVLVPNGEAVILILAWITDRSWYGRLAAWLFQVTGQTPDKWDDQNLLLFEQFGFKSRSEQLHLPKSTLLVLHLKKAD